MINGPFRQTFCSEVKPDSVRGFTRYTTLTIKGADERSADSREMAAFRGARSRPQRHTDAERDLGTWRMVTTCSPLVTQTEIDGAKVDLRNGERQTNRGREGGI